MSGRDYTVSVNTGECVKDALAPYFSSPAGLDLTELPVSAPSSIPCQSWIRVSYDPPEPFPSGTIYGAPGFNAFYVGSAQYHVNPNYEGTFSGTFKTDDFTVTEAMTQIIGGPRFAVGFCTFDVDNCFSPYSCFVTREVEAFDYGPAGTEWSVTGGVQAARAQGQGSWSTNGATGFTMTGKVELYPQTGPNAGITESVVDIFYQKEEPIPIADFSSAIFIAPPATDQFGGSYNGDHLGLYYYLSTNTAGSVMPSMALTIPPGYGIRSIRGDDMVKTTYVPISGTTSRTATLYSQWR